MKQPNTALLCPFNPFLEIRMNSQLLLLSAAPPAEPGAQGHPRAGWSQGHRVKSCSEEFGLGFGGAGGAQVSSESAPAELLHPQTGTRGFRKILEWFRWEGTLNSFQEGIPPPVQPEHPWHSLSRFPPVLSFVTLEKISKTFQNTWAVLAAPSSSDLHKPQ